MAACERNQYSRALGERLDALEREREEIESELAAAPAEDNVLRLHPNLSEVYGRKVAALTESLNDEEIRQEAAEVLRGLIDKVVLTPCEGGGADLTLHGDLARILTLCEAGADKSKPSGACASEGLLSVVAGARNHRELTALI